MVRFSRLILCREFLSNFKRFSQEYLLILGSFHLFPI